MSLLVEDPERIISYLLLEALSIETTSTSNSQEKAFAATTKSPRRRYNGPPCTHCGRKSHGVDNCYAPGGKMEKSAPAWYKPPGNMGGSGQQANAATTPATSSQESARMANHVPDLTKSSGAILDSGSTSHMTNQKAYLELYTEFQSPMLIGSAKSGSFLQSLGHGNLTLKFILNGKISSYTLRDVLYVPELETDLVSVSKLEDDGLQLHFRQSKCFLSNGSEEFGYAERVGSLYRLRSTYPRIESANMASTKHDMSQDLDTWHRRFGHASEARIRSMVQHDAVDGISLAGSSLEGRCEACILAKHAATPSPGRTGRASEAFQVIHSDLMHFGEASFGGAKYGLTFIDEMSGYTWVYAITDKTAETILGHFRELDTLVQTQFGHRIKALHSDNGGEYVNNSMSTYLASRGIEHHTIAPHRHEMNGIAERANRSAGNSVRAMLIAARLPQSYWAEAYYYWAYVHNRTSLSFLEAHQTPFSILFGSKPDVGHLRVFGSVAYVRVPPDQRRKLDPKSEKCTFVGCYDNAAYRLMRPDHSIIKSKDVIFEEGPGVRTLTGSVHLDLTNVNPAGVSGSTAVNSNVSETATASSSSNPPPTDTSAPASIPSSLRRSKRSDHTSERRRAGIEQEQTLSFLDHPAYTANAAIALSRKHVAGIPIPRSFKEAADSPQRGEWFKAASYEIGKLMQHEVWNEVPRPVDAHIISGMWVFNIKENPDGSLEYRMRWVARGDSQLEHEFGELHATSGDYTVARLICALAAVEDGSLLALDISSAYLHSPLDQSTPIYVEFPTGFSPNRRGSVCKLQKALYGLKQGARAWQDEFRRTMSAVGFSSLVSAPSAFRRCDAEGETIAGTHVDDLTVVSWSAPNAPQAEGSRFEHDISKRYQYTKKDLSSPAKLLGWTVVVTKEYVRITVEGKIKRMAERYGLKDAKTVLTPMASDALKRFDEDQSEGVKDPSFPYRNAIGELMWLATNARPDIAFATQVLARYIVAPKTIHWEAVKRVIRYLLSTQDIGINYKRSTESVQPSGFCDADWGRDPGDRRSVSGYVFTMGGGAVSWKVKRQLVVALSTAEAEYLAASQATREAIWMRHFFEEIGRSHHDQVIEIFTDNMSALKMSQNPILHNRTKHIDIPVHHIRDEVQKGRVVIKHLPGEENPADIFTKPLARDAHFKCMRGMGMF